MHKPDFTPARELSERGQQLTAVDDTVRDLAKVIHGAVMERFKERPYKIQRLNTADIVGSKLKIILSGLDNGDNEYHITLRRVK